MSIEINTFLINIDICLMASKTCLLDLISLFLVRFWDYKMDMSDTSKSFTYFCELATSQKNECESLCFSIVFSFLDEL